MTGKNTGTTLKQLLEYNVMNLDWVTTMLSDIDKSPIALVIVFCFFLVCVYEMNRNDDFNVRDIFRDRNTGKAGFLEFGQIISLLISSWAVVTYVTKNQLTDMALGLYLATWSGSAAIARWLDKDKPPRDEDGDGGRQ